MNTDIDFSIFGDGHDPSQVLVPKIPASTSLDWIKQQAEQGIPVWAICAGCDHSRLLDPADLLAILKPRTAEPANQLRCRACGHKAAELRAATPIPEYFA